MQRWRILLLAAAMLITAGVGCIRRSTSESPHLAVDAGDDQSIEAGQSATLSASVAGKTEGYAFRWDQQTGPDLAVAIATEDASETEVGPIDTVGDYKFRVVASSADAQFGHDFVTVTVTEAAETNDNADANDNGDNANENINDNVTDDNENATDANDNSEPNDNADDNQNADDNDNAVEIDPDEILVRANAPEQLPVGEEGTLIASQPPGGLAAEYEWTVIAGDATIDDATSRSTTFTPNALGVISFRVTMTVPEFNRTYTDEIDAEIVEAGTFKVAVSGPTETTTFTPVTLTATFGSSPGTNVQINWEVIEGEGEFDNPALRTPDITPSSDGIVIVRVTLSFDLLPDTATDDYVLVVYPNRVVELEGQVNNLVTLNEPTTFTVTAANFDDADLEFEWSAPGFTTIDDANVQNATITILTNGTEPLTVTARGEIDGLLRSGTLTIFATTVNEHPQKAEIVVAGFGTITVELDGEAAPQTVANFLHYADDAFYNGVVFHRSACSSEVIDGLCDEQFVLQGGGYERVDGELVLREGLRDPVPSEAGNGINNSEVYTMAMALSGGNPDSGTSQFFINLTDNAFLDDQDFTAFGRVVDGFDVLDAILAVQRVESTILNGEVSQPAEDIVITRIERVTNRTVVPLKDQD